MEFSLSTLPAPMDGGFKMEGYWVWCGSVIEGEDGKYHMFASRWSKELPMHPGWLLGSEIVRAVSDTPEGPYDFEEIVLERRGPQYWDGRMTHNPVIVKHKDKFLLYYIGSTHPFKEPTSLDGVSVGDRWHISAVANQRIGIAIADSVYGPWERFDKPILETRPEGFDNYLVANPSPIVKENGEVILIYKGRGYIENLETDHLYTEMKFGVATAPHYRGPYQAVLSEPLFDTKELELEDPFVWEGDSGEYYMVAKDMDGRICGEARGGIMATSKNGLEWNLQKDYLAYSKNVLWDDGKNRMMGSLERPYILFKDKKPTHIFFATSDGVEGVGDCKETWNMVIPIK